MSSAQVWWATETSKTVLHGEHPVTMEDARTGGTHCLTICAHFSSVLTNEGSNLNCFWTPYPPASSFCLENFQRKRKSIRDDSIVLALLSLATLWSTLQTMPSLRNNAHDPYNKTCKNVYLSMSGISDHRVKIETKDLSKFGMLVSEK